MSVLSPTSAHAPLPFHPRPTPNPGITGAPHPLSSSWGRSRRVQSAPPPHAFLSPPPFPCALAPAIPGLHCLPGIPHYRAPTAFPLPIKSLLPFSFPELAQATEATMAESFVELSTTLLRQYLSSPSRPSYRTALVIPPRSSSPRFLDGCPAPTARPTPPPLPAIICCSLPPCSPAPLQ